MASTTARIVEQAASILEEEIAAGVVAAKRVERRFLDVGKFRAADPDEVMQRFRRDAHEVVDILLDLANAATDGIGSLAQRAVRIRGGGQTRTDTASRQSIPTLVLPVRAGTSGDIAMSVENDGDSPILEFTFHCTDLVDGRGNRLPARHITFAPTTLALAPHTSERVVVLAEVPAATAAGTYSGLLQASQLDQLRAVLLLEIE